MYALENEASKEEILETISVALSFYAGRIDFADEHL